MFNQAPDNNLNLEKENRFKATLAAALMAVSGVAGAQTLQGDQNYDSSVTHAYDYTSSSGVGEYGNSVWPDSYTPNGSRYSEYPNKEQEVIKELLQDLFIQNPGLKIEIVPEDIHTTLFVALSGISIKITVPSSASNPTALKALLEGVISSLKNKVAK